MMRPFGYMHIPFLIRGPMHFESGLAGLLKLSEHDCLQCEEMHIIPIIICYHRKIWNSCLLVVNEGNF